MRAAEQIVIIGGVLGGAGKSLPAGLTNWRAAVAAANAGTGPRKTLLVVGDSTTMGQGSGTGGSGNLNGAYPNDWVSGLATKLKAKVPTCFNTVLNSQASAIAYPTYDPRVTLGANWTNTQGSFAGTMFKYTTGAVNNFTFTPTDAFDTIIVTAVQINGNGTATINVDGGSSLGTISFSNAPQRLFKYTFTVPKGTHTINIVPNNDATFFLPMVQTYDSTTPAIDIVQAGSAGATAQTFVPSTNVWDPLNFLKFIAPVLTIIDLTINDSNSQTLLATYSANIQTIITAAKLSGDVMLMVGPPSNTIQATNGTLDTYIAALQTLAASNGCSLGVNMKALWGSYLAIQGTFPYFDGLHCQQSGYQGPPANGFDDISTAVTKFLSL